MVMRYLKLIIFLLLSSILRGQDLLVSVAIDPSSEVRIDGESNINSFTCKFPSQQLPNLRDFHIIQKKNGLLFPELIIELKTTAFDCGNRGINRDFQALLKAENHPNISIKLIDILKKDQTYFLKALINIAGKEGLYELEINQNKQNTAEIFGIWKLNIRDFELTPPKKILGLITIKDEIEINFKLFMDITSKIL